MNDAFELEICQGKYRYRYEAGKQEVWRNGEPWEVMNGRLIGDKFVFSLAIELDEAIKERDALRSEITAMKQQVPICRAEDLAHAQSLLPSLGLKPEDPLYALPGAQPAPSVPDISDDMIEAIESRAEQSYRRHHSGIRGQQITPADALSWHIIHATRYVLVETMEAQP